MHFGLNRKVGGCALTSGDIVAEVKHISIGVAEAKFVHLPWPRREWCEDFNSCGAELGFQSSGCAFNQIVNMVAKSHYRWGAPAPLVLRGPAGGGVHGGPFHSQNPEMHFVHTPGIKVVAPATPSDAKGLIKSAIRDNNPVLFLEHKFLYRRIKEEVPENDYTVPIGKARLHREGRDLSIITYAAMVHTAQEAADLLAKEGVEVEILDLRTLSPLDREAIVQTVKKTNKVILLHEDTKTGGLAGEIAAIINEEAFEDLDGPIVRITALDTPVPFSPPLEHFFLPKVEDVVREARKLHRY